MVPRCQRNQDVEMKISQFFRQEALVRPYPFKNGS